MLPRNDDWFPVDRAPESPTILNPDTRVCRVDETTQMLSGSWTKPTPWDSPREEAEDDLLARLRGLAEQLEPGLDTIFNLHCPPHGTSLDRAPQLTADLKVVLDGGEPRIVPVGSTAVRTLNEEVQHVLSPHGHIHQSTAVAKDARTPCIHPGSP